MKLAEANRHRTLLTIAVVLVGLGVLVIAGLGWAVGQGALVRGPMQAYASQRLHRSVRVASLKLHLGLGAPEAEFADLRIAQPDWAGPGDMLVVPHGRVKITWASLFGGAFAMPLMQVDHPVLHLRRDAGGRSNWQFGPPKLQPTPFHLPPIRRMVITDGRLDMQDVDRKLVFAGTVATGAATTGSVGGPLRIAASGTLEKRIFRLDVTGAPITDLAANQPYPITLHAQDGPTSLDVQLALSVPFDLGHYAGTLHTKGDDLSDLYRMTGAVLPNTPPYDLTVKIKRDDARYQLTEGAGRVGGSDLEGDIVVDKVAGRRKVQANLTSRRLVFADLTSIVGNKPHSAAQIAKRGQTAPVVPVRRTLLPTAPLYVARLRQLDATVHFSAASVQSAIALSRLDLGLDLQGGVLTIRPLTFQFTHGLLTGQLRIDARSAVPITDLQIRLSDARLQDAVHAMGAKLVLSAPMSGYAQVHGRGLSVHDTAATLQGRATLMLAPGLVDRTLASLAGGAGVDLAKLIANPPGDTPLRCGLIGFQVQAGQAHLSPAVIDTGVATLIGSGDLDLGQEQVNVRVVGHSKRPALIRVLAPITFVGPLSHPKLGVDRTKIVAQTVTGVLSSIVTFGGALPFLAGPGAPDVDCAALMSGKAATGLPQGR